MQYTDIINNGTLVYKSLAGDRKLREWRIEESFYSVKFYRREPLSELDLIFLRLIKSMENQRVTREELALTLGFDVADKYYGNKRFYKDNAEVSLFNKMLEGIFKWNLIAEYSEKPVDSELKEADSVDSVSSDNNIDKDKTSNEKKYIRLTKLGQKALEMNCKFSFFSGKKTVYANINKSDLPEDKEDFPFYSALGLYTDITDIKPIEKYNPDNIDVAYSDELIRRLNLQSNSITNIFSAESLKEWKYSAKDVDISVYLYNEEYYPIIFYDDKISTLATDILYREQNVYLRNQKIKKALYYKLINNVDSIINYSEIKFFEDYVDEEDFELIIKDKRTDWNDPATYNYIVSNDLCIESTWDAISLYCPAEIIMSHIADANSKFDLVTLSRKLPITFIIDNSAKYNWDFGIVLSRDDISNAQAQELMLCDTNSDVEWDWDTIEPHLDVDFVLSNIDKLNTDFYHLTAWLPVEHYSVIVNNIGKKWDWLLFVNKADINLIIDNIQCLEDYVGLYMEVILDRALTSSEIVNNLVTNNVFKKVLESANEKGKLITYNLGIKSQYAWCDELIDYLEQSTVLTWNTIGAKPGFARYSYIIWDSSFFRKYYHKINSIEDSSYISENISDLSLLSEYKDFPWDWDALSRNTNFSCSEEFLALGKELVSYESWMHHSNIDFSKEFFDLHNQWMRSLKNTNFVSKSVKEYSFVLENQFYPWKWDLLAQNPEIANDIRFCDSLIIHPEAIPNWITAARTELVETYFDKLELSKRVNKLIDEHQHNANFSFTNIYVNLWDRLSSTLSPKFIYEHINERWNSSIITKKLIPIIEESSAILKEYTDIFDWKTLSEELSESFIINCIDDYKSLWEWNTLTQRLPSTFVYQHFKDYLQQWNQNVALNKIANLLTKEDILDPDLTQVWDWQIINDYSSDKLIFSILRDKDTYLNWTKVSNRICNNSNCNLSEILGDDNFISEYLNWDILNSHMPLSNILNYKDLKNAKWNWSVITERFDTAFIVDNLQKYSCYWDWNVILNNKFNRNYVITNLSAVKDAVSLLDTASKRACWSIISSLYTPSELLSMSETKSPLNGYEWDYSYVYKAITDPDSFAGKEHTYVDWKAFSASEAVNKMFAYDSDSFVFRTWKTIVKSKLNNSKFDWDYSELTKQESIQDKNDFFYDINPERWDWSYISQFGKCLLPLHKGKYMRKYKDRLDFSLVSTREDIDIDDEMISNFVNEKWDWALLSSNPSIHLSFDFIFGLREKSWDWSALSRNKAIKWNLKTLRQLLKTPEVKSLVSWNDVVTRSELDIDDSILEMMTDVEFSWTALTGNQSFRPSIKTINKAYSDGKDLDWSSLSKNKHIDISFVKEFKTLLDWTLLTANSSVIDINEEEILDEYVDKVDWVYISHKIKLCTEKIVKYRDVLDWGIVNKRFNYNELDISQIDLIQDYVDWTKVSSASIVFTEEFLHKYRTRIDWYAFSKNESVDFSADLYKDFVKELNRIKFLDKMSQGSSYPYIPMKVYHFSHMFNAIDIIKNRKIMSRDKAMELNRLKFSSAGSVIKLTSKAHPYARFYYRPKSPTQFYNECLGWDNTLITSYGKNYYSEACNLHLPKCPMPVFFEFDIREIIAKFPDKCYYSSGNLQTYAASIFKIDETPDRLRLDFLYNDISDAKYLANNAFQGERVSKSVWNSKFYDYLNRIKEQSQQEFLVKEELDFSQLDSYRIICYDEFQKDLLINYLGDDSITSKIEVDYSMYSHDKRQLNMTIDDDEITISSDYDLHGCAYLLVKGGDVKNKNSIKNFISSDIVIYPTVVFDKKNPPSEVYLVDPNPRADTKEWLIYKS